MMQKKLVKKQNSLIWLGTIVNTHGLKGELRILSNSDDLNKSFKKGTKIFLKENDKPLIVKNYRLHKNFVLVFFENIDTFEEASKLKNEKIYKEANLNVDEEFYLKDLIDATVINDDQKSIGIVIDLLHQIAYESIVVKLFLKEKIINIPLVDEFFIDFDSKKHLVYVKVTEEFINESINE